MSNPLSGLSGSGVKPQCVSGSGTVCSDWVEWVNSTQMWSRVQQDHSNPVFSPGSSLQSLWEILGCVLCSFFPLTQTSAAWITALCLQTVLREQHCYALSVSLWEGGVEGEKNGGWGCHSLKTRKFINHTLKSTLHSLYRSPQDRRCQPGCSVPSVKFVRWNLKPLHKLYSASAKTSDLWKNGSYNIQYTHTHTISIQFSNVQFISPFDFLLHLQKTFIEP